jgi:adenylate kinase family enzyme
MKVAIIGYAGSGKSTLANVISKKFNLPVLHVDTISFYPNWVENSNEERLSKMTEFLSKNNENWVIDGNYYRTCFDERMEQADSIILLNFNRFTCYFQALKRAIKYRNKERVSAPKGCKEKFSLSFQWWILFSGRTNKRKKIFKDTIERYKNKVIILKNRKEVNEFIKNI